MIPLSSKRLSIKPICEGPRWDEFVASHPRGSLFHTSAMVHAFAETPDYEPLALVAIDGDGNIVAGLVATKILISGAIPSSLSARSVFFAEPIGIPGDLGRHGIDCLMAEHDRLMSDQVVFSEIRPITCSDENRAAYAKAGYESYKYNNYELDLRVAPDEIFRGMSPKRRNNIRANERRGVSVREADPQRELDVFYEHLTQSHSRSKIPLVDIGYFEQIFSRFSSDQIRLTFAELDGRPIASACHLFFNERVYWSHAGTYRIPGIAAQASLVWETIQWSIPRQYRVYDFAGAGWADEIYGPGVFKQRFGGQHLDVGRYRKVYSKWRMKIAETGFRMTRPVLTGRGGDRSFVNKPIRS